MKNKQIFLLAYLIISLVEITADLHGSFGVVYVFKPLIILSLLFYSNLIPDARIVKRRTLFMAGLIFALLGDIFLMIRETDLFIPGLGSFLLMQILYISAFQNDVKKHILSRFTLNRLIPFLGFALLLYLILQPYLPDPVLKTAVGIYAFSIAVMAWTAFLRKEYVSSHSFLTVFSGAILFMLSDSLIAVNRFLIPIPLNTIWVMSTYAVAQYLIVTGFLKTKQAGD